MFRTVVERSSDMLVVLDGNGYVEYSSPAVERLLGYPAVWSVGANFVDVVHPDDVNRVAVALAKAIATPRVTDSFEFRASHADGTWRHLHATANTMVDDAVGGLVISARDVTDRKRLEDRLVHQALHDPLTGLPNRVLLRDRLAHALARSGRQPDSVAVLFLDLDHFKLVNDSLGHDVADRLLVAVARSLQNALRPAETVARLGGDEFVVLCEDISGQTEAVHVAQRVADACRAPVLIDNHEITVTTSIGVALAAGADATPDALLRDADDAMYRAKDKGRARFEFFDSGTPERNVGRVHLENELRRAVEDGDLDVLFQPQVGLLDGRIHAVEALVRWDHPRHGPMPPGRFVPVAEESGLIDHIGRVVLREACWALAGWRSSIGHATELVVSVNVSPRQLASPNLGDVVLETIADAGLPPSAVCLEITENTLLSDFDLAAAALAAVKASGVQLAVDDFGVGYASLGYLKHFPIDQLKIDKSFINRLADDRVDSAIVTAITSLAAELGLTVVAEGVETLAQADRLRELGCELAQGFYFSAPVTDEELAGLLRNGDVLLPR